MEDRHVNGWNFQANNYPAKGPRSICRPSRLPCGLAWKFIGRINNHEDCHLAVISLYLPANRCRFATRIRTQQSNEGH